MMRLVGVDCFFRAIVIRDFLFYRAMLRRMLPDNSDAGFSVLSRR